MTEAQKLRREIAMLGDNQERGCGMNELPAPKNDFERLCVRLCEAHRARANKAETYAESFRRDRDWALAAAAETNDARLKAEAGRLAASEAAHLLRDRLGKAEEALWKIERMCVWGTNHARIAQVARSALPKDEDTK